MNGTTRGSGTGRGQTSTVAKKILLTMLAFIMATSMITPVTAWADDAVPVVEEQTADQPDPIPIPDDVADPNTGGGGAHRI
ncbi:MAG: hypothetical protein LBL23_08645 [Coriobacteriales bacterium]|nr:hypothetical protein [Coriobacteriales bacterium]